MQTEKRSSRGWIRNLLLTSVILVIAGCQSGTASKPAAADTKPQAQVAPPSTPAPAAVTPPAPVTAAAAPNPAAVKPPVRIKAGPSEPFKDADGNEWLTERGFDEGSTVERPDLQIANTKTPAIYHSERYSMTGFHLPIPNGKYIVKLHFCETFEGISGPGERVFGFNVEGHEFKDFDLWVKSGGALKAYIETVNVEVTDGKLDITFTPKVENPEINGIEILPAQ